MKKRRGYISVETIIIVAIVLFVGVCFLLGLIGKTNDSKETQDKVFDDAMLVVDGNTVGPDGGIIVPDKPEPDKNKVFHGGSLANISKISNLTNLKIVHIKDLNFNKPKDGVQTIDVSANGDGSVLSWTDDSGISYIAGKGGVKIKGAISFICGLFSSSNYSLEEFHTNNLLDTSEATSMNRMFYRNQVLRVCDLSGVDTSNVEDMEYMFGMNQNLETLNIESFNTVNVKNMGLMFYACEKLKQIDVSHFNTKNVTKMNQMFGSCKSLTMLNLSSFNTSNVVNMSHMFYGCNSLIKLDLSGFNTSNVTIMSGMFNGCRSLIKLDLSSFNTSNVTIMSEMFFSCYKLKELDLSSFDIRNVTNMYRMFSGFYDNMQLEKIYVSSLWQINENVNTEDMFKKCKILADQKKLDFNDSWDGKKWLDMANYKTGYLTLKE